MEVVGRSYAGIQCGNIGALIIIIEVIRVHKCNDVVPAHYVISASGVKVHVIVQM